MANPIQLPTGFEMRKLGPEHTAWAQALISHSNVFHSPLWSNMYPRGQVERAYNFYRAAQRLCELNIASGLSYGVFDTAYQLRRAAPGLYWDETDMDATPQQLLEQMDFPLVSVHLSYDEGAGRDHAEWAPIVGLMPLFGNLFRTMAELDPRDPASWRPASTGEVLVRGGTATRADYGGRGLARAAAHWLMHEAAAAGYRAVQIGLAHPAMHHIWMNPPPPFTAELICSFNTATREEVVDGVPTKPWVVCGDTPCSKIWVNLK